MISAELKAVLSEAEDCIKGSFEDAIHRYPAIAPEVLAVIAPYVRREFLIELKQRAKDDGFEFFSSYNEYKPTGEYTDADRWFDTLIKEEG